MKPDELMEIIKSRRSVRQFKSDPVPRQDIEKIVEAASWAPSGTNKQNWSFIVIESKDVINRLAAVLTEKVNAFSDKIDSATAKKEFSSYSKYYTFFVGAPVLIAVVKKPYDSLAIRIMERYGVDEVYKSTADVQGPSAAIQNMLLMAYSMGYGTCWMTGPMIAGKELEEALDIKAPDELMALIPLGRPDAAPQPPKRKSVKDIIEFR